MRLVYDKRAKRSRSPDGVKIRVPGWGDPSVVEHLDPEKVGTFGYHLNDLVDYLVFRLGYVRGKSLLAAPYDFRKAPST